MSKDAIGGAIPENIKRDIYDQIDSYPMMPEFREENRGLLFMFAEYGYKLASPSEEKRNEGMKVYDVSDVFEQYRSDQATDFKWHNHSFMEYLIRKGYKFIQPSPDKPEH